MNNPRRTHGHFLLRWLLAALLALTLWPAPPARAEAPPIVIPAASFVRHYLIDPNDNGGTPDTVRLLPEIRRTGKLAGEGWVEYDFQVPTAGWYGLNLPPGVSVGDHDFFLDAAIHAYGGVKGRVLNAFLASGPHTLRVQRLTWPGLADCAEFDVVPAGVALADTTRIDVENPTLVLRRTEPVRLRIACGGRTTPTHLTVWVKRVRDGATVATVSEPIPASPAPMTRRLTLPNPPEGLYTLAFGENGRPVPADTLRGIQFVVIDTAAHPSAGGELKKTLLQTIDCVSQTPDADSGAGRVLHTPLGAYRESGTKGYLQSRERYDFFSYQLAVPQAQRPYLVEVDAPDDDQRTFAVALMERNVMEYPPVGGFDDGGTYRLSHRMQTQSYVYYPRGTDVVCAFVNCQDGRRAAASKIRLYRIDGDLPALPVPKGGRDFAYWLEEGDRWATFNGAPDKTLGGHLAGIERWAETARYMGVNVLMPTVVIYQASLYPNQSYPGWFRPQGGPTDPMPLDIVRLLLLVCEKYGLRLLPEFHPTWNGYKRILDDAPYAADPDPKPHLTVSNTGEAVNSPFRPYFNPIYPRNADWYVGMLGEFTDRYRDSPALAGVSLRVMGWVWESHNGWPSLRWGYDDYTIHAFEHDTGIAIPETDTGPGRFAARFAWLMAHPEAKAKWIDWRCTKITGLYARISQRVRVGRPDLLVVSPVHAKIDDSGGESNDRWRIGDYAQIYREAGYDMSQLGRIPNVLFLNALYYYGRRQGDPWTEQQQMDMLLDPAARDAFVGPTGRTGFLFSNSYFEADEAIDPARIGLPGVKRSGWVGALNPSGTQYLQRYAEDLADADASLFADGGEGYLHGQAPLRGFLREYRTLPPVRFTPRPDARDPVAVWELPTPSQYWFYAVNREDVPIPVTVRLSGAGAVVEAATGQSASISGGKLTLTLPPMGLAVFRCAPGRRIASVATDVPGELLSRVGAQVRWLTALAARLDAAPQGVDGGQRADLDVLSARAASDLARRAVFAAASTVQNHRLLAVYQQQQSYPPDFYEWKAPPPPADAIGPAALASVVTAGGVSVPAADATAINPDWTGGQVVATDAPSVAVAVAPPVLGRYRLTLGQVVGGEYGPLQLTAAGRSVGTHGADYARPENAVFHYPDLVLPPGPQVLTLTRTGGARLGLNWMTLTPLRPDLSRANWSLLGPFPSPTAGATPDTGLESAAPVESLLVPSAGTPAWQTEDGDSGHMEIVGKFAIKDAAIVYGVTYVHAPTARKATLANSVSDRVKLWLNGRLVKDMAQTAPSPDKNAGWQLDVVLDAGWNVLTVKADVTAAGSGDGWYLGLSDPGDLTFSRTPPAGFRSRPLEARP